MRIENKPKSISKNKTLVGAFFSNAGTYINGTIKKYFGIDIGLSTTNFDKNLDNTIVDVQKLADRVDELEIPDAQIQSDWNQTDNTLKDYINNKPIIPTLPAGTENQTIRKGATNWEANDNLKSKSTINWSKVPFALANTDAPNVGTYALQVLLANTIGVKINNAVNGLEVQGTLGGEAIRVLGGSVGLHLLGGSYGIRANYNAVVPMHFTDGTTLQFQLYSDGSITATKFYQKNSSQTLQRNNLIADETGKFIKEPKNIGILLTDTLINGNTLVYIPNLYVNCGATNYYHCQFRIILKRLVGASSVNVFGNSGLQFQFTNGGVNEIEILGGLRYEYFYSDGVNDQAVGGAFDCMNFEAAPYIIDNADFALNSTDVAEYLIVDGSFTFLQATNNNDLKLYIAKVTDAEDYTVEKGSFIKITLKNEG